MTVTETSLLAFERIVGKLPKCRLEVLACIDLNGPVANKEISVFLKKEINKITGRTSELRDQGLVECAGTKIIDGFSAKTWRSIKPTILY